MIDIYTCKENFKRNCIDVDTTLRFINIALQYGNRVIIISMTRRTNKQLTKDTNDDVIQRTT